MSLSNRSKGFTFIEVLFAVILLGIGFIMIAAVFPVAIQQTSAVSDETQGSALARDAIKKIQAVADSMVTGLASSATLFPATGTSSAPQIWPITTTGAGGNNILTNPTGNNGLMAALGTDAFFSADHRFGWVGFYRRDSVTSPFAQIYVIALENPNFANYLYPVPTSGQTAISAPVPPPVPPNTYGFSPPNGATSFAMPPNSATTPITAQFYYNADGSTSAVLTYPQTQSSTNGATGAFVLICASRTGSPPAPSGMIGRFFRLGVATNASNLPSSYIAPSSGLYQIFQVQPGYDITPADAAPQNYNFALGSLAFSANVWLIGAAPLADTTGGFTGPFSGPNQDIGVATGFIRVNTANN